MIGALILVFVLAFIGGLVVEVISYGFPTLLATAATALTLLFVMDVLGAAFTDEDDDAMAILLSIVAFGMAIRFVGIVGGL